MLTLRTPNPGEIALLKEFAPPDWSTDISSIFAFHYGHPYFYPLVAELDGNIVGCANGLLQGRVGWLGNIIVSPAFRNRGLGTALTRHLMDYFTSLNCTHQLLIASKLGEPIYRKLGFEVASTYIFLKPEGYCTVEEHRNTRPLKAGDADAVYRLDGAISGEMRWPFLKRFLPGGWVHTSPKGEVDGFYLPNLANGPILAENETAGLELLRLRISQRPGNVVVPEGNPPALAFLRAHGFAEVNRARRMALGEDVNWRPECVFSRGSGFCG